MCVCVCVCVYLPTPQQEQGVLSGQYLKEELTDFNCECFFSQTGWITKIKVPVWPTIYP